jgi:hypothetical protein
MKFLDLVTLDNLVKLIIIDCLLHTIETLVIAFFY